MAIDPAGIGPFFESFGEIQTRLVKASAECADPAMADLFRALAAQMEGTGAEFKSVAARSVEEARRQFKETREATQAALAKGRQTVDQLKSLVEKNQEFLKNAPRQTASDANKPSPPVPKVKAPKITMEPLDFSSGEFLREWLLHTDAPKAPPTPRTHGNIWDDWKAVPPDPADRLDDLDDDGE